MNGMMVEPHMVERVAPAYRNAFDGECVPESRWKEQKGWTARRGTLQAWSMSRDAACTMLGFMEGRRSAAKEESGG